MKKPNCFITDGNDQSTNDIPCGKQSMTKTPVGIGCKARLRVVCVALKGVTKDVLAGGKMAGIPARLIGRRSAL